MQKLKHHSNSASCCCQSTMNAPQGSCFINSSFAFPQRSALNNSPCLNLVKKKTFVKGLKTSCPFGQTSSSYFSDWIIKPTVEIGNHNAFTSSKLSFEVVMWKQHGSCSLKWPKHCFTWTVGWIDANKILSQQIKTSPWTELIFTKWHHQVHWSPKNHMQCVN